MPKFPRIPFIVTLAIAFVMSACGEKEKSARERMLPSITGRIGEVMVVCSEALWQSEVRTATEEILAEAYPALPQSERMFDILRVTPANFSGLYESHRNILWLQTNSQSDSSLFRIERSRYAREQLIIRVQASNQQALKTLLEENKERIQALFNGIERRRLLSVYRHEREQSIYTQLLQQHNIHLNVPRGFSMDVDSSDFVWLSNDTEYYLQGIWIYHYPYTDPKTFTPEFLINKRNEIGNKHIPGGLPGAVMETETLYPPEFSQFTYNKQYFAELRGLWKMTGGVFMGGPFVSLSTLDTLRNRVITIEAYVFAPNTTKRNFVRNLEAIPYSLKVAE